MYEGLDTSVAASSFLFSIANLVFNALLAGTPILASLGFELAIRNTWTQHSWS